MADDASRGVVNSLGNLYQGNFVLVDTLTKHLTDDEIKNSMFYTCGSPGMIKAMQDIIQNDLKIPKDRIKVEEFTGY
jgi:ferredoxin-NADP reductase